MLRNKSEKQHPAIKTRLRDGLFFPDNETFELSFSKLFSLPLPLYFKSFYIKLLMLESNTCRDTKLRESLFRRSKIFLSSNTLKLKKTL